MNIPAWREEAIAKKHDRKRFDRGQADINAFLAQHARKAHGNGASKTYAAIDKADGVTILGFYAVSPAQVDFDRAPAIAQPGGRYAVGGFRLGRHGVDEGTNAADLAASCSSPPPSGASERPPNWAARR